MGVGLRATTVATEDNGLGGLGAGSVPAALARANFSLKVSLSGDDGCGFSATIGPTHTGTCEQQRCATLKSAHVNTWQHISIR